MDILSRLFGKKNIKTEQIKKIATEEKAISPEGEKLYSAKTRIEELLDHSHYVARSEYLGLIPEYEKTIEYFKVLRSG